MMVPIEIHASNRLRKGAAQESRYATWAGDPGWISAPIANGYWVHCGGWAAEMVHQVFHNGPDGTAAAGITIEIQTDEEVIRHLIDSHGFTDETVR